MAQSLNKIFLHNIFYIKTASPKILDDDMGRVHEYIGQLINTTGCQAVRVGGICDHIHAVGMLSREKSVAHTLQVLADKHQQETGKDIKSYVNTLANFRKFINEKGIEDDVNILDLQTLNQY